MVKNERQIKNINSIKDIISCLDLEMKTFLIFTNLWLCTNPPNNTNKAYYLLEVPNATVINRVIGCEC